MVLAGAVSASGCALAARPEAPGTAGGARTCHAAAPARGPRLSRLLGLTGRGLTFLVRSGADLGQAGLGWREAGGPRRAPDAACGDAGRR